MITNFIIGFFIPWLYGIYLYIKSPKIIVLIAPFASVVAFTINDWGFNYDFWEFTPIQNEQSYSALSYNLGVFPLLFCAFVYFIHFKKKNILISLIGFVLLTTLIELGFVMVGKVIYGNSWTIWWTFLSYLIAYVIAYGYYKLLRRHQLI